MQNQIKPEKIAANTIEPPQITDTTNEIEGSKPIRANSDTNVPSLTPHPAIDIGTNCARLIRGKNAKTTM